MKELIGRLEESRGIWLESLLGIEEEEARWREAEDRWSVLDCAEHVSNVEHRILRTLQNASAINAGPANPERERRIYEGVRSREKPVAAPDLVRPAGRYATLAEATDAFAGMRQRAIEFLRTHPGDLRAIGATHPLLGPCNGYEYALILAAHPIRHAVQIREIREARRAR